MDEAGLSLASLLAWFWRAQRRLRHRRRLSCPEQLRKCSGFPEAMWMLRFSRCRTGRRRSYRRPGLNPWVERIDGRLPSEQKRLGQQRREVEEAGRCRLTERGLGPQAGIACRIVQLVSGSGPVDRAGLAPDHPADDRRFGLRSANAIQTTASPLGDAIVVTDISGPCRANDKPSRPPGRSLRSRSNVQCRAPSRRRMASARRHSRQKRNMHCLVARSYTDGNHDGSASWFDRDGSFPALAIRAKDPD